MAKESVKILQGKLDVKSLIDQLNAALSEEWLAYYQYWVGALVVEGAMRADVQGEFEEHAEEERHHAQLIADRIIELEGVRYSIRKNGLNWLVVNTILQQHSILSAC